MAEAIGESVFVVALNPQQDSRLPYLLRLPIEGGLVLKARAPWPATARVYCHRFEEPVGAENSGSAGGHGRNPAKGRIGVSYTIAAFRSIR